MGPVILCHAFEDKKVVRCVYDALQESGFEVWLDSESVLGEQDWEPDMADWLRQAACMLVFLSKNSVRKIGSTQHEFGQLIHAWKNMPEGTVYTIPIRINDCQIPDLLSRLDHIDFFADHGMDDIIHCLNAKQESRQMHRDEGDMAERGQALQTDEPGDELGSLHLAVDGRGEVVNVSGPLRHSSTGSKMKTKSVEGDSGRQGDAPKR
jgi:hypothetical protein